MFAPGEIGLVVAVALLESFNNNRKVIYKNRLYVKHY